VFESASPSAVMPFWQRVLDYSPGEERGLADPLRRDPAFRFRGSTVPRPLRNRIHLDVVRPASAVEQVSLGEGSGPYGVCHSDVAANLQSAARELGATADPGLPRFVQLFFDAADVSAVRSFWVAALGYTHDRRGGVSDILDPRRLSPELVFQELDASEDDRRRQRNRVHVELAVPADLA